MTLTGICTICSKPAMYSCSFCGKVVCIEHYVKDKRMCSSCMGRYGEDFDSGDNDIQKILY